MPLAWPNAPRLLPACCLAPPCATAGIEEQIARLSEIESLKEEWQIQVGGWVQGWLAGQVAWWACVSHCLGALPMLHARALLTSL
jgi:hypothetical protein